MNDKQSARNGRNVRNWPAKDAGNRKYGSWGKLGDCSYSAREESPRDATFVCGPLRNVAIHPPSLRPTSREMTFGDAVQRDGCFVGPHVGGMRKSVVGFAESGTCTHGFRWHTLNELKLRSAFPSEDVPTASMGSRPKSKFRVILGIPRYSRSWQADLGVFRGGSSVAAETGRRGAHPVFKRAVLCYATSFTSDFLPREQGNVRL
jgi:hypothetical protein